MSKRVIIMGASSGIGYQIAERYIADGWTVGLAARREEPLKTLQSIAPERVFYKTIDVTSEEAIASLNDLITQLGGIDHYYHSSGLGYQNKDVKVEVELEIMKVNVIGFTSMIDTIFNYMKENGGGHISVISSIAGTKGLGPSPAYSASKALQYTYIQSLSQLSSAKKYSITFTDIRPGFVATAFLGSTFKYPMLMSPEKVADMAYRASLKRKRIKIIDWRYRILVSIWRRIPIFLWEKGIFKKICP